MMNKTEQRFEAAKAAMHGLLSNSAMDAHNQLGSPYVALWAIEYADALLAELARTESTTEKSQLAPDADGWVVRIPTDPIPDDYSAVKFRDGVELIASRGPWRSYQWEHKTRDRSFHITHYRPA
jgi:hypothetical protein